MNKESAVKLENQIGLLYSSESKVRETISALKSDRKAFYSPNIYLLAGVLFEKHGQGSQYLSAELQQVMTAF